MRLFIPFIAIIIFTAGTDSPAQSIDMRRMVIGSAGSSSMENGYYISQTAGESFSGTSFANFHFLTQGFQQPSLINEGPPGQPQSLDAIDVYPNPVSEHVGNLLTVSFRIKELTHYYIDIFNVHGARLFHQSYEDMTSQDIKVDFSRFGQGIFFVRVYSANLKMDRHFKIEKF